MKTIFIPLFTAFVGSFGFALLFNVEKKNIFLASLGGLLSWGIYLIGFQSLQLPSMISVIFSAAFCQFYAENMARIRKVPATLFSITAAIPLIPGGSLYRTMYAVVMGNWENARLYGFATLQTTFGIAIGTSFVAAIFFILRQWKKKRKIKR